MAYNVTNLRCGGLENPMGIDCLNPVFSWIVMGEGEGTRQKKRRVMVARFVDELERETNLEWDDIKETEEMRVTYQGKCLEPCTTYFWKVQVISDEDEQIDGDIGMFETAFLSDEDWTAKWICLSETPLKRDYPASGIGVERKKVAVEDMILGEVYQVRKEFFVKKKVKRARAYITAHGAYLPMLDGKRVGHYELAPGHSDYANQLFYQIYDITDELQVGYHAIGAYVADGWYRSRIGFSGENCQFGTRLAILMQLEVEYQDGGRESIGSDKSFLVSKGAYQYADLMVGEKYDAQKELAGFFEYGYGGSVKETEEMEIPLTNLKAQPGENVEVLEEISPIFAERTDVGDIVLDFGKCVAGKVRIRLRERAGTVICMEHSEVKGVDGSFLKNIQTPFRDQQDIYVCAGKIGEVYEPMFTYHGFRYVKISGITREINLQDYQAVVVGSRLEDGGFFRCSDGRMNQLQENIRRSQLSNMISIPTDCPQREKAGWTGDVQIYAATACYNQNMKEFFRRWLSDVRYEQTEKGQIPIIVPFVEGHKRQFPQAVTSAGWGDVITVLPWVLYQYYGDKAVLEENYEAMERWLAYVRNTAKTENPSELHGVTGARKEHLEYIWNTNFHFGDWLTPSVSINMESGMMDMLQSALQTKEIVPTFFYAYSCSILSKVSKILGKDDKRAYYDGLFEKIKEAFQYEYVNEDGTIKSDLQGIQVLALHMGLVDGKAKEQTEKKLVELIHANGDKLDTGFLSVPYLLDVLCDAGYKRLAYKILYQEECPSWLYEVKMGATSVWESWQAILPDGKCTFVSLAHYAYGCVGNWIYRNIVGIRCLVPGYKRVEIAPDFECGLESAEGGYHSIYGEIRCGWKKTGDKIVVEVAVPFNTEAQVFLRNAGIESVKKCGRDVTGEMKIEYGTDCSGVGLPAGSYQFICTYMED